MNGKNRRIAIAFPNPKKVFILIKGRNEKGYHF
jgi:hypothetical protein